MATQLPIYDSLSHPTLTGSFPGSSADAGFAHVSRSLRDNGFIGGCAVGMHGVGGYDHGAYLRACSRHDNLYPVAGFDPNTADPHGEAASVAALGYRAIKLHPRQAGVVLSEQQLAALLEAASAASLVVFLCTYYHAELSNYPASDPLFTLVAALKRVPQARVVLLHGGDVRVLQYAQLVRNNPNLLLDLSFTLLKYRGSSVDLDISHICQQLDRRVCIGADFPDFDHAQLRSRFDEIAVGIGEEKARNVAYRSITEFLGVSVTV